MPLGTILSTVMTVTMAIAPLHTTLSTASTECAGQSPYDTTSGGRYIRPKTRLDTTYTALLSSRSQSHVTVRGPTCMSHCMEKP
ncbi:hypothetical protein PF005_g6515 [Phytophthora fragariae]|uniref:RxLR effector protein n=1 Tax=Phytophthora fragariae TaxID=53985 RepID=A0A6A4EGD3_9STRA|nr:hypothetical protein PF003_g24184 [Phytophthora fragariae]KAE8949753.1 hypothetical protein PF009_g726 [Phytophthora fragariae]KAE9019976.1 hypothetical protein PF011_g5613 [Phytophthora fragariae]KAE9125322.1 hypothetical protein PF007_g6391 [Phytophthora fragariae]KAE9149867.1 hypothetical protein PF006_g5690 [Phytophthora fragariae]